MSFTWRHLYFSATFLLASVWGNFNGITILENEDHFAVVKVGGGKYENFEKVDCSHQIYQQGYYDDGTACKNVNISLKKIDTVCIISLNTPYNKWCQKSYFFFQN